MSDLTHLADQMSAADAEQRKLMGEALSSLGLSEHDFSPAISEGAKEILVKQFLWRLSCPGVLICKHLPVSPRPFIFYLQHNVVTCGKDDPDLPAFHHCAVDDVPERSCDLCLSGPHAHFTPTLLVIGPATVVGSVCDRCAAENGRGNGHKAHDVRTLLSAYLDKLQGR